MQKGLVFANWKVDRTLLGVFQGPNKSVKTNTHTSALESRAIITSHRGKNYDGTLRLQHSFIYKIFMNIDLL